MLLFLSIAGSIAAHAGHSNVIWLLLCYLMLVFGELCISPVGLALVTRLAPEHLKSTMMGVWWTISAYAGFFGGVISSNIAVTKIRLLVALHQDILNFLLQQLLWLLYYSP